MYGLRFNILQSIKEHATEIEKDMDMLSRCDYVIAHNDSMVKKLKDFGCTSHLVSLKIFDYDCHFPEHRRHLCEKEKIRIVFAGYLAKAEFLDELDKKQQK